MSERFSNLEEEIPNISQLKIEEPLLTSDEDSNYDGDDLGPTSEFKDSLEQRSRSIKISASTSRLGYNENLMSSKINNRFKSMNVTDRSERKYSSFSLNMTDRISSNSNKLTENIYLEENDDILVSNHAVRVLLTRFKVKYVAQCKIKLPNKKENVEKHQSELKRLLNDGFEVKMGNDGPIKMVYYGNSKSGLKENSFWMVDKESSDRIDFNKYLRTFGNFTKAIETSIEKFAKGYSLMFSSSKSCIELKPSEYIVIPDEMTPSGDFEYTDGIGLVRLSFSAKITEKLKLEHPCHIFQIRCGGFKGVLTAFDDEIFDRIIDEKIIGATSRTKDQIQVIFRESQRKFECHLDNAINLNVVSYVGHFVASSYLNMEFLMVLDGLTQDRPEFKKGIVELYRRSLDDLDESLIDPMKAYNKLIYSSGGPYVSDFAIKYASIILACKSDLRTELDFEQYKIVKNQLIDQYLASSIINKKINIYVENSKYLMGISDETKSLEENEVYVCYRDYNGQIHHLHDVDVIVARTPCYGLSEIQKVRAKRVDGLMHLVNCVAFSQKGDRPLTNVLSGGDLDGDLYFVSWDTTLTCFNNTQTIIQYPKNTAQKKPLPLNDLRSQLIDHFLSSCLNDNQIGLFHYYLLCLYEKDRNKMASEDYIKGVFNINKAIDGIPIREKEKNPFKKPPVWYLTSKDLAKIQADTKDDKMKNLNFVLSIKIDSKSSKKHVKESSLLGELMNLTYAKFIDIYEKSLRVNDENVQFISSTDIETLKKHRIIDSNIDYYELNSSQLEETERAYRTLVREYKRIEQKVERQSVSNKKYVGEIERNIIDRQIQQLNEHKLKLTREFKNMIINLEYCNLNLENAPEVCRVSMHSFNDIFLRTRILNLYLKWKNTPFYYQIPWIFYEILVYLKNQSTLIQDTRQTTNFIPFSLPVNYATNLSFNRMLRLKKKE